MPVGLSNELKTAISQQQLTLASLVKIEFEGETVYLNDSGATIYWDNKTWPGIGDIGQIDDIERSEEIKVLGMTVTLSGINDKIREYVAKVKPYAHKRVTIYTAYLDDNYDVVDEPVEEFIGTIESMSLDLGGESSVTCEIVNELASAVVPQERRYTNADQQAQVDSTDTGLSRITEAVAKGKGVIQVDWRLP